MNQEQAAALVAECWKEAGQRFFEPHGVAEATLLAAYAHHLVLARLAPRACTGVSFEGRPAYVGNVPAPESLERPCYAILSKTQNEP